MKTPILLDDFHLPDFMEFQHHHKRRRFFISIKMLIFTYQLIILSITQ